MKLRSALIASLTFVAASVAQASPITYDFTMTATSGPLSGVSANGTFTFDSSSITPGSWNLAPGLLTALDLTWNGITYNASMANTGGLAFDALGNLGGFYFGTRCAPDGCLVYTSIPTENFLIVDGYGVGSFSYELGSDASFGIGTVSTPSPLAETPPAPPPSPPQVPEPLSLSLFSIGLLGAAWTRRKAR